MSRIYTEREAEIYGRRRVCYREGHKLSVLLNKGFSGGVQGAPAGGRVAPAACDEITCDRCDVTFAATYPPIGQEAKP
jgi:hypothetical protein